MLHIRNLYKSFGQLKVLQDINLDFSAQEVAGILGPSGAGKSTLLRCINLLEIPDQGSIQIANARVEAPNISKEDTLRLRKHTAMVFQHYALFKNKTVLENVTLALRKVKRMPASEADQLARELLDRVQLSEKLTEYPSRLSGGQQQRVGIARALAADPDVLLFDEPTSALDHENVAEILNLIRQIAAEKSKCLIIVTHEIPFAESVADTLIYLRDGKVERQEFKD